MSALYLATAQSARACAEAANHVKSCDHCPDNLTDFLDHIAEDPINSRDYCYDGLDILAKIRAADTAIAEAVRDGAVTRVERVS